MKILSVLLFTMISGALVAQGEPVPETQPSVLALFSYFSPEEAAQKEFGYALFTIPDLVRENLLLEKRFKILDPIKATPDQDRGALAKDAGADFYLWGYLVRSGTGLKVFHNVVDTATGKTIHLESEDLPVGVDLIDAMTLSARKFSSWIRKELPEKAPQVRIVEVVVEKTVERPLGSSWNAGTAVGAQGFSGNYTDKIQGTGLLEFQGHFSIPDQSQLEWGFTTSISTLKEKDVASLGTTMDVLFFPVLLTGGVKYGLWGLLDLGWELKGGEAFLFGRYGSSTVNMVRPLWSTGPFVNILPEFKLSGRASLDYMGTWIDFDGFYLPSLRLILGLTFDL